MDGVLVSWAVPKGPTLDPDVKRMAVHVEDHPLGYFDFEGVIPAGEYGGGDVIVWDWGTWSLAEGDDPRGRSREGELHFDLVGEKLHGRFVLVRRRRRGGREAVAAAPQARRPRRGRLGPRGPPALGEERADQRRGEGRARGHVEQPRPLGRSPTADELAALDALAQGRGVDARRAHAPAHQPRQGAVPAKGGRGGARP